MNCVYFFYYLNWKILKILESWILFFYCGCWLNTTVEALSWCLCPSTNKLKNVMFRLYMSENLWKLYYEWPQKKKKIHLSAQQSIIWPIKQRLNFNINMYFLIRNHYFQIMEMTSCNDQTPLKPSTELHYLYI